MSAEDEVQEVSYKITLSEKLQALLAEIERLGALVKEGLGDKVLEKKDEGFVYRELRTQMDQIRSDQVVNSAGGYVFAVSDESSILRFLILGSSGGTYYSSEQQLTISNLENLITIINKGDAHLIIRIIYEVSLSGRNPKQNPLMLALALCARYLVGYENDSDPVLKNFALYLKAVHHAAFSIVNEVCRIPTHLFAFVNYCEMISKSTNPKGENKSTGWGRQMRNTICNWYYSQPADKLALHLTKYKKREGYSHRDLFRLAHPVPKNHKMNANEKLEIEQLYHYAVKASLRPRKRRLSKEEYEAEAPEAKYSLEEIEQENDSKALDMIEAYLRLNKDSAEEEVVHAIKQYRLVREHIPTEHLNSVDVWHALLDKSPMTALIRNLGKLSSIKALDDDWAPRVVDMLTNEESLKKAKIHPLSVLLAKSIYSSGRGDKGSLTWEVNPKIDDALENAFYKCFFNAPPTNKRMCFAFDISGSMCAQINGTHLSCRTASAAMSLISLHNEKDVQCVGFCDHLVELPYDKTWNLQKMEDYMNTLTFGSTDCALPMLWAAEKNKKFDVFVVYTDNETYYGDVHPFEALRKYREASGIRDARLIVMGMTATKFTIADPSDSGMLDIVGFDSAVPQLIHEFITGKL